MTQYTIKVNNKSANTENFLLFNSEPTKPTHTGVWSNVWIKSPGVGHPSGIAEFKIDSDLYAVCGMTNEALADGVSVSTSDSRQVNLKIDTASGTKVFMDIEDGGAVFKPTTSTTSTSGCFAISTAAYSATSYPNAFCGLGRKKGDTAVPVATWGTKPSEDYEVAPVEKFYVSTGDYEEGNAVDVTQLGASVTIDFTGSTYTVATTTLQDDGTYTTPTYTNS